MRPRVKLAPHPAYGPEPRWRVLLHGSSGRPLEPARSVDGRPLEFKTEHKAAAWARSRRFEIDNPPAERKRISFAALVDLALLVWALVLASLLAIALFFMEMG